VLCFHYYVLGPAPDDLTRRRCAGSAGKPGRQPRRLFPLSASATGDRSAPGEPTVDLTLRLVLRDAEPLLNAPGELIATPCRAVEIIVRELAPLLLGIAAFPGYRCSWPDIGGRCVDTVRQLLDEALVSRIYESGHPSRPVCMAPQ
jgi:hypothetical protein